MAKIGRRVGKTDKTAKTEEVEKVERAPGSSRRSFDVAKVRLIVARLVWAVCVVFALALAVTALLVALDAEPDNDLVRFAVGFADAADLGLFSLEDPIKDFDEKLGPAQDTKSALFNYGIGAVVWLVVGRILERVIRP